MSINLTYFVKINGDEDMKYKIDQIKGMLRRGDITTVASIVGCSDNTIRRMINYPPGHPLHRNIDTKTGEEVMQAFQTVLRNREALRNMFIEKRKRA